MKVTKRVIGYRMIGGKLRAVWMRHRFVFGTYYQVTEIAAYPDPWLWQSTSGVAVRKYRQWLKDPETHRFEKWDVRYHGIPDHDD